MSPLRGWLTPELRASLEAVLAKLAAPGMANPDDKMPAVDEEPSRKPSSAIPAHRPNAITTAYWLRCGLCWPAENSDSTTDYRPPSSCRPRSRTWNPPPVKALTACGSLLPMSDVIRLASHAHHYLAIFDNGKALALYHTKRLASPAQRIMLYAKDRGCTKPGCPAPAYYCQAHHVRGWQATQCTDIDDLALACGIDNRLAENGWTTRKNAQGETEWIPPPHLDHGQPRTNNFHHPEKLLRENDEDPGSD